MNQISVTFCKSYDGKPMASIDVAGCIDLGYWTPERMRGLAAALVRAAADCEARPLAGKHVRRHGPVVYSMESQ